MIVKFKENLAHNTSRKIYLKVGMCSLAPDPVMCVGKYVVSTSFANVYNSLMAALILVESFHIETLCEEFQNNVCPRFSVQQMQHEHYLLPPALLNISVEIAS
jgi:hypothetical protein